MTGPTERSPENYFNSDKAFNLLYPQAIRDLDCKQWTRLEVAVKASNFLAVEKYAKVLDIGSGAGKFCLVSAYNKPEAFFTGVEQRENLIRHSEKALTKLELKNVHFIHANFTDLEFTDYDHFYFYNSFYENVSGIYKIDDKIVHSEKLYHEYHRILFRKLEKKPAGTRLAMFYGTDEAPDDYHVVGTDMDGTLKFLIKV